MRTLIALFAAVAMTVPAHATKPSGKPCGCNSGNPHAPSPSPAPAPNPSPAPTPSAPPNHSPAPSTVQPPAPAPAPAPSPVPAPSVGSPAPSQQSPAARIGMGVSGSSGSWKPWNDPQYLATLEPRRDYLPPDPVMPPAMEIPEPTPQPSTEIIYIPYPVEVLVPYPVEVPVPVGKTVNVCPVIEKKPARKPIKQQPKVCK